MHVNKPTSNHPEQVSKHRPRSAFSPNGNLLDQLWPQDQRQNRAKVAERAEPVDRKHRTRPGTIAPVEAGRGVALSVRVPHSDPLRMEPAVDSRIVCGITWGCCLQLYQSCEEW